MVAAISRGQLISGLQTIGAVSTMVGGVAAAAQAILGQDYTYACTVMTLGAWTWLSVSIGRCAQKEQGKNKSSSKKAPFDQEAFNKKVDAAAETGKKILKVGASGITSATVSGGKAALVVFAPGVASAVTPLLDVAGESAKGISDKSIDVSVDVSGEGVKKSAEWSAKK